MGNFNYYDNTQRTGQQKQKTKTYFLNFRFINDKILKAERQNE